MIIAIVVSKFHVPVAYQSLWYQLECNRYFNAVKKFPQFPLLAAGHSETFSQSQDSL